MAPIICIIYSAYIAFLSAFKINLTIAGFNIFGYKTPYRVRWRCIHIFSIYCVMVLRSSSVITYSLSSAFIFCIYVIKHSDFADYRDYIPQTDLPKHVIANYIYSEFLSTSNHASIGMNMFLFFTIKLHILAYPEIAFFKCVKKSLFNSDTSCF